MFNPDQPIQSCKEDALNRVAFAQVKTTYIKQLPMLVLPRSDQELLINLVDGILSSKESNPNANTSSLEYEVDQMVYELYGLTPEKIAVVEGY